jgi:serine phosphatase RsbU (regulator of sigma subunit)
VTESSNTSAEEFGEDRLVDALRNSRKLPAAELASAIVNKVMSFSALEQFDDITLIVANRVGNSERSIAESIAEMFVAPLL